MFFIITTTYTATHVTKVVTSRVARNQQAILESKTDNKISSEQFLVWKWPF